MAEVVLDASALLAFVNGERGGERVADVIAGALVSTVNFSEAVAKLIYRGATLQRAREILAIAHYQVVDFDRSHAETTGALIVQTSSRGLSLGDRACLALAQRERLPALTSDRSWLGAVSGIEVQLFR